KSAEDFQYLQVGNESLYMSVSKKVDQWNLNKNCGLVVGATKPEELSEIREKFPTLPFLVPGVGAQGGDLKSVIENGKNKERTGLLINVGRDILYQGSGNDFAKNSEKRAQYYFEIMSQNFE
ncbi:MAG: orotidine 5'-phosphate decarboxylase, partial [Calditrichia bacterium]|nr:orotidine 5'-phosphate decarboxylase [Calditrichia bacterium]